MSIDGHTMLVIASDGSDVTPTLISSLGKCSVCKTTAYLKKTKSSYGSLNFEFTGLYNFQLSIPVSDGMLFCKQNK